jgi:hypothetical protein
MAYKSTIQNDWTAHGFRRGNAYQLLVNIGVDEQIFHTYSLAVGFEPLPGGTMEFYFCLVDADDKLNTETTCFSGLNSINFLPGEERPAILKALLSATQTLIRQCNPKYVTWCTWDDEPPPKALRKHLLVARVFEVCGYKVEALEVYQGRHGWSAERLPPPGVPDLGDSNGS